MRSVYNFFSKIQTEIVSEMSMRIDIAIDTRHFIHIIIIYYIHII